MAMGDSLEKVSYKIAIYWDFVFGEGEDEEEEYEKSQHNGIPVNAIVRIFM